jgi:hypothetical protein
MWLALALLFVVLATLFFLTRTPATRSIGVRQTFGVETGAPTAAPAAPATKRYRIWTPGTSNGVEGRYYMAAFGVTQASANKIASDAAKGAEKPYTVQQVQITAATMALGTVMFYFRAKDDTSPFNASKHLAPIGNFADITSDDVFALTQLPSETLLQVPAIDNAQVSACDKPDLCRSGVLGFGGIVDGSPLQFKNTANGAVSILRQTPQGPEALYTGPNLCPYQPEGGVPPSQALIQACSTIGVGGPRVPRMSTGAGDSYYLEPVA